MAPFETKLRKVCERCTESSIKTYLANVKALAKIAGLDTIPNNADWLGAKLLAKIKKDTLGRYKRYAIAGKKALQAYGKKSDKIWGNAVADATGKYDAERNKQKRTLREQKNWPKGGYKAMKTLAADLAEEVHSILKTGPKHASIGDLYRLQRWFVVTFYAHHALRGDLAEVRLEKKGQDYLHRGKNGNWHVHIGQHKTVRAHGAIDFELDPEVQDALDKFLPFVRALTDHGYLLTTLRTRSKMSRRDMLMMLRKITEERLGVRLGVHMIRVLRVTEFAEEIDEAAKLREELGDSAATQIQYVAKATSSES